MKGLVFAGPTLWGANLCWVDLEYAPPAAQGDIAAAIRAGYRTIVLIDGVFGDYPAVQHKEILWGLSHGACIVGTASMGALRAAECHTFGMLGHGTIFEEYASETRRSDADVAVIHAPGELAFRPLSVSLVDVHATLERVRNQLPESETDALLAAAKLCYFPERTIERVVGDALSADRHRSVIQTLKNSFVNRKQEEALAALDWVANMGVLTRSCRCDNGRFNRTGFMRYWKT